MSALALPVVLSLATACIPDGRLSHIRDRLVAHAMVESGFNPLAIHDNTTQKSYFPSNLIEARRLLTSLSGHSLDAGIAQVTRKNWQSLRLSVDNLFDAGANLCGGAVILIQDYEAACRYNTGKPNCPAGGYPQAVDRAMEVIWRGSANAVRATEIPQSNQPSRPPCDARPSDVWGQTECRMRMEKEQND